MKHLHKLWQCTLVIEKVLRVSTMRARYRKEEKKKLRKNLLRVCDVSSRPSAWFPLLSFYSIFFPSFICGIWGHIFTKDGKFCKIRTIVSSQIYLTYVQIAFFFFSIVVPYSYMACNLYKKFVCKGWGDLIIMHMRDRGREFYISAQRKRTYRKPE